MITRSISVVTVGMLCLLVSLTASAQRPDDPIPLKPWAAPLFWQAAPNGNGGTEGTVNLPRHLASRITPSDLTSNPSSANPLVFVGMTPCRIVDTRPLSGFPGAFGAPSLVGGTSRTFPVQSSSNCPIPSTAQAYSFNISVVPSGFLDYITVWPTGQPRPLAATLTGYVATVISNAAIVPAGTGGAVDVYAAQNTDLVIDINGYYIGITNSAANTALGLSALSSNTTGTQNTAIGNLALANNVTGINNTATGSVALGSNTTGGYNTAIGTGSLLNSTTAINNTAIGAAALFMNTTGINNAATGETALWNNTTGGYNTAIGTAALYLNTSGINNTAIGYLAGATDDLSIGNVTGSNNTFVGFEARPGTSTQLKNATAVGANASVSADNTLVLGDPTVSVAIGASTAATKLQVIGDIRVGTSGTNGCIQGFDGSPIAGTCSSDARLKQNIQAFSQVLDKLIQLQPVFYNWNIDEHPEYRFGSGRVSGLIAQEVEKIFPDMVAVDDHGYKTVNYSHLPLLLLQAMRDLKAENDMRETGLTEAIKQQQEIIGKLYSQVEQLKASVHVSKGQN